MSPRKRRIASPRPASPEALKRTLSLLEATFESTTDGLLVVDLEGRITAFNRKFTQMWGIPDSILAAEGDDQALGYVLSQIADPEGFLAKVRELYARPDAESYDVVEFQDGRIFERYSQPQRIGGRAVGRVWSFRDVSPRRRAERVQNAAYQISHATLGAQSLDEMLRAIHEIVGTLLPARNFYVALLDEGARQIVFPYFVDERDHDRAPRPVGKGLTEYVIRTGQPLLATPEIDEELARRGEIELVGPASIDWLGVPLRVRDRVFGAVVVQSYSPGVRYTEADQDLLTFVSSHIALAIERQRTAEELRQHRDLLHAVIEGSLDHIFAKDLSGRYILMNSAAARALGRQVDNVVGKTDHDVYPAPMAEQFRAHDRAVMASGTPVTGLDVGTWVDGQRTFLTTKGTLRDAAGAVTGVFGVARDITQQQAAEEALRQSGQRYRSFIEHSTEGVWRFELDPPCPVTLPEDEQIARFHQQARLAECNDAIARMYGRVSAAQMLGVRPADLRVPSDPRNEEVFRAFIRAGYRLTDAETHERDSTGRAKTFLNNYIGIVEDGHLVRIWGTQRDVTDQRRLEDQFRQVQKMEAVGQLAGGIAHDFNNILTAILGTCQLLLRDMREDDTLRDDVGEIRKAALRAADLTRQLLAYSRRQILAPKVLDLNAIVNGLGPMLRRLLGEDVELTLALEPELGRVRADPGQVEQVLVNLAVNARDAMPQGGRLTVETTNTMLDGGAAVDPPGAAPGAYVVLSVTDTGTGMTPEVRSHVFEPFFTTKEVGKGTGLGLATVYGIVRQSGGAVGVSSEIGRGTTFRILLPRVAAEAQAQAQPPAPRGRLGGTETLLLVEDEEAVRTLSRRGLEAEGYTVLTAENAADAIGALERFAAPIDMLITDLVMPGMGGRDLAQRLVELHPSLRVLYITGYTTDAVPQRALLQKPFTPDDLARRVRAALDEHPATPAPGRADPHWSTASE